MRTAFRRRKTQKSSETGFAGKTQVDKEWETHIISLNQNIKDAVAAHKRERAFVDVMEGRYGMSFEEPPAEDEDVVVVGSGADETIEVAVSGDPTPVAERYAEARVEL